LVALRSLGTDLKLYLVLITQLKIRLMFYQLEDTTRTLRVRSQVCSAMAVKLLQTPVTGTAILAMMEHGATAISVFNKANTALTHWSL